MTYAGFLLRFLVIPLLILGLLTYHDMRLARKLPAPLRLLPWWLVLAALAVMAVIYTTPWDNYLVASGVWWYDPALVTGITLGWVPLEEYVFFVLQTLMTGLWLLFLARRLPPGRSSVDPQNIRIVSTGATSIVWLASVILLISGWQPANYLALELAWALPVIGVQLALGADILWQQRRLLLLAIGTATLYLCGMDGLAIHSGTWTINPERSLGLMLGGILPVEEAVFFLLTNSMLVFGLTLGLARETLQRLPRRKQLNVVR